MIIFIAPIYRRLIRKQAQFSAKTQSHLIETLSGIQTVKAQHLSLIRWKWQERYSGQIQEGFKSVVLGSTAGEFGNFLNQLSSLLIIGWRLSGCKGRPFFGSTHCFQNNCGLRYWSNSKTLEPLAGISAGWHIDGKTFRYCRPSSRSWPTRPISDCVTSNKREYHF